MASLSDKNSTPESPADPYSRDRIEREIAHLRNRGSVRHADGKRHGLRAAWPALLFFGALLWLYFMDPVLHSYRRGEAVRDYLYLHHYGSDPKAHQLVASGILSSRDVELLNLRQGSFQNYYAGPVEANHTADSIISYLKGVSYLQAGLYDRLDLVGKIRYQLFVRWGILPPTSWELLDPTISQ